jgi:hypothetical protein
MNTASNERPVAPSMASRLEMRNCSPGIEYGSDVGQITLAIAIMAKM